MWPYASEAEAIRDVLRLSRGMSYKNALADLPFGGGKSVIIGDPRTNKTVGMMRAMGRAVERLGGRYIIAEDVGTNVHDMDVVSSQTSHVAGLRDRSGDPSPATAYGVFVGIDEAVRRTLRRDSLEGVRVSVQGLGHVGHELCTLLAKAGVNLFVTDIRPENMRTALEEFGAVPVNAGSIYDLDVDVFAPCALGAVINDETIPRLNTSIIAGSANNQLAEERHGIELARRGILWCPDYLINSGGVINISHEMNGSYDRTTAFEQVGRIRDTLSKVMDIADHEGISTSMAADRLAEQRLRRHGQQL
jgi:leucine dehydrogenase